MVEPVETVLTTRQVEVLEQRSRGKTQQEVANELGTTDSNVSSIERAARENIEKARRTLELSRTIDASVRVRAAAGDPFETLIDRVYAEADAADISVAYSRPELSGRLFEDLGPAVGAGKLKSSVVVGVDASGEVELFVSAADPTA
jgi:Tfx family DNA-binding protein